MPEVAAEPAASAPDVHAATLALIARVAGRAGRNIRTSASFPPAPTCQSRAYTRRRLTPSSAPTRSTSVRVRWGKAASAPTRSRRRAAVSQSASVWRSSSMREGASLGVNARTSGKATWAGSAETTSPVSSRSSTASAPSGRSTRQRRPACSTRAPGTKRRSIAATIACQQPRRRYTRRSGARTNTCPDKLIRM